MDPIAYLPSFKKKIDKTVEKISNHYEINKGFLSWSGGNDSTALMLIAYQANPKIPVVWFDSGLEYPETREYIENFSEVLNLNINIVKAEPDALTILEQTGSWDHKKEYNKDTEDLHNALIFAPAKLAHTMYGVGELTGLRASESTGRRVLLSKNDGHYTRKDGSQVFAPLWAWKDEEIKAVISYYGFQQNPVYEKLKLLGAPERAQRVGLIVDGNNPNHGRYTYLRLGWPDIWNDLVKKLPRLNEWR